METFNVILTSESVDEILWCDYWVIPENIRTIPRTAFRNSEGKGGFLELEI